MILTVGMAHPRKLIRHAVVALLIAANTAAGVRVKPTRVEPHKKSQLPALGVYTLNDPVDEDASTETEEAHELELEIVGWVAHTDSYTADDAMDDIADQVEAAMKTSPFLNGTAGKVVFVGTTMQVVKEDGASDPTVGVVVLTYVVDYRVDKAAAATLDDFLSVAQSTQTTDSIPDDTVPASDEFIVQEIAP